jgi:hypothetical protein
MAPISSICRSRSAADSKTVRSVILVLPASSSNVTVETNPGWPSSSGPYRYASRSGSVTSS